MATETKTFYLSPYDQADTVCEKIENASNPVGKSEDNTTYASIYLKKGSSAETFVYWPFDVTAIPDEAEITSVECKASVTYEHTTFNASAPEIQLYCGATAKGSSKLAAYLSQSPSSITCGEWTRSELSLCRLRVYAKRNLTPNTNVVLKVYGASLTVTYTYQNEKFMLKLGGAWHDIARVFKKVKGIWVEQTDLANVIPDNVRYQNGGEIESTGPALITFTIDGTSYQAEEGMTWSEWVASSYNTAGLYIWSSYVKNDKDHLVATSEGFYVAKTDIIQSGHSYIMQR